MRIELYPTTIPAKSTEDDFLPYLDTFLIDSVRNPLGAVLILPGGGYNHRAFHEGDPIAEEFNRLGYHAFVLQYRVRPNRASAPRMDVARAIKIIRANAEKWYIEPDKIAVCGFSAGGHLAACAGMLEPDYPAMQGDEADHVSGRANAMILCYGVLSLKWIYERGRTIAPGSPYCHENGDDIEFCDLVDDNTPPAYVWHTATDATLPVECSVKFAREMWKHDRPCELHIFPTGPHGRGLGLGFPDIVTWAPEAAKFLEHRCNFNRAIYFN